MTNSPILLDGLGEWRNLGTLTPTYGNWLRFPQPAEQGFTTFRATFTGDWYRGGWHWIYLKEIYRGGSIDNEGKWVKVYPSESPKIVYLNTSDEFNYLNPQRSFEVLKGHKYIKTYGGRFNDKIFSVKLEEFSPYPELMAQAQEQTLKEQVIRAIAEEVIRRLPPAN